MSKTARDVLRDAFNGNHSCRSCNPRSNDGAWYCQRCKYNYGEEGDKELRKMNYWRPTDKFLDSIIERIKAVNIPSGLKIFEIEIYTEKFWVVAENRKEMLQLIETFLSGGDEIPLISIKGENNAMGNAVNGWLMCEKGIKGIIATTAY